MKATPRAVLDVRLNRTQVGKSVDGVSRVSWRKMPTAEEVEDNLSQRRMEKPEECAIVGNGGTRGRGRRHRPPGLPIQVLGT